jgi:hypothetical protein
MTDVEQIREKDRKLAISSLRAERRSSVRKKR